MSDLTIFEVNPNAVYVVKPSDGCESEGGGEEFSQMISNAYERADLRERGGHVATILV